MIIFPYRKCRICKCIFDEESECPVCGSTNYQSGVTEEEYLEFLISIDELPRNATIDDILPYCIQTLLDNGIDTFEI